MFLSGETFTGQSCVLKCVYCFKNLLLCVIAEGRPWERQNWLISKQILNLKSAYQTSCVNPTDMMGNCPFPRRLRSRMGQNLSMYAAVRAPIPGVKRYWHNKGMFIHGGDESADVSVICDDNLIELSAYWGDKKATLLIKTSRVCYRQGWGPTGAVSVNSSVPSESHGGVIIRTWRHDGRWKVAALHVKVLIQVLFWLRPFNSVKSNE